MGWKRGERSQKLLPEGVVYPAPRLGMQGLPSSGPQSVQRCFPPSLPWVVASYDCLQMQEQT